MSPRRIRVLGAHADFLTPRGWPTPTDDWVRANAFWQPPSGWTPIPGLKPAPTNWTFWATNKAWDEASAPHFRPAQRWSTASGFATFGWIAANLAAWALDIPPLRVVALASLAAAIVCLIMFMVQRHRISRALFTAMSAAALDQREQRLSREYQRYLTDPS